jgi:tyrosine-protein phosphatase SIW14
MPFRGGLVRQFPIAAVAALCLAAPASAQTAANPSAPSTTVHATSGIRIDNFGRISNTYFRGGQPEGQDYAALAGSGVKTVINLESDDAQPNEAALVQAAGMKYVNIPMTTHAVPTPAQIAQFLSIVGNPADQPVYVHCVGGRHRTGVMTAIYRMTDNGWSATQAFAEMKKYKFGMDFLHPEFKTFVLGYHATESAHAPENRRTSSSPSPGLNRR